ncbi:protein Wnt-8a-like isoform X2 [Amblyomma americanum]
MVVIACVLFKLTLFVLSTTAWSSRNDMLSGSRTSGDAVKLPSAKSKQLLVGRAKLGTIDIGVRQAIDECQAQFRWDRWNCPERAFDILRKRAKPPATREMAFVQAIMSAGITYTIAKNCSRGNFRRCTCDHRPRKVPKGVDWTWGGCSDNVQFGYRVSRRFLLDRTKDSRDLYAIINKHNNRAGSFAVRKSMRRTCKCHGPSGSCALKTCWMQLGEMAAVGDRLRRAYERARLLISNRGEPAGTESRNVLLYTSPSSNFCQPNLTLGYNGTYGRECSRRTGVSVPLTEQDSCSKLCYDCGHGLRQEAATESSTCNCRFVWCCSVKCDICTTNVQKHFCN